MEINPSGTIIELLIFLLTQLVNLFIFFFIFLLISKISSDLGNNHKSPVIEKVWYTIDEHSKETELGLLFSQKWW